MSSVVIYKTFLQKKKAFFSIYQSGKFLPLFSLSLSRTLSYFWITFNPFSLSFSLPLSLFIYIYANPRIPETYQ